VAIPTSHPLAPRHSGEFIVCESTSGDGIDGLSAIFCPGSTKSSKIKVFAPAPVGGLDDDIFFLPARAVTGMLLPKVRDCDEIERGQVGQL